MSRLMIAASSVLIVACSGPLNSGQMGTVSTSETAMAPMSADEYIHKAHDGHLFEVRSGQVAMQASSNNEIRSFARLMVSEHTRMANAMIRLARGRGTVRDRDNLSEPKSQMLETLRLASKTEFDAAYKRGQVAAHEEALSVHRDYAARGDQPALKEVAKSAARATEFHLNNARALPD